MINVTTYTTVRVIDLSSSQNLVELCLQETGGLGVNCIIDNGGTHKLLWTREVYKWDVKLLYYGFKNNKYPLMLYVTPLFKFFSDSRVVRMVTKVKDHPYCFVIITRLLKDNLKCLVNKQPKTEDKKK